MEQNVVLHNRTIPPVTAVADALDLLSHFTAETPEWRLSDLSRTSGMSKNKVFRLLRTMASRGFIVQNRRTRTYRLGGRVLALAHAYAGGTDLRTEAQALVRALAARSGESVFLNVLDAMSSLCIECVESSQTIHLSTKFGQRQPLYSSVTGKVLLASLPDEEITAYLSTTPLVPFTPRTITNPARLWEQIRQIRRQGYAINVAERDPGACAIGAPVRDATGEVVAAFAVGGPADRMLRRRRHVIEMVCATAAELSERLGYLAPRAARRG